MAEEAVAEIGIDSEDRLYVRPSTSSFGYIWRAGMEVNWDGARRRLVSPRPREWSYADWFRQITKAVVSEYGVHLRLNSETAWSNVPSAVQEEIISSLET